ncbi:MAG: pyroglutamyl-peptidase [Bradymonadia bacterium]
MTKPRILFTGFEPFGGADYNPSWPVANAAATASGCASRLLPVTHSAVKELGELRPASLLVVAVGLSRASSSVAIETVAHRDGGGVPDNAGVSLTRVDTQRGPPLLRVGTLATQLVSSLAARTELDVFESEDAGRYICNALLYHLLEARGTGGPLAIFVHVPELGPDAARALGVALGEATQEALSQGRSSNPPRPSMPDRGSGC